MRYFTKDWKDEMTQDQGLQNHEIVTLKDTNNADETLTTLRALERVLSDHVEDGSLLASDADRIREGVLSFKTDEQWLIDLLDEIGLEV